MNPFISAPYYGMPQQQYGSGGYGPQQQQQYGAGGGSYSTNYNFEPDWSHNAVSCAGGKSTSLLDTYATDMVIIILVVVVRLKVSTTGRPTATLGLCRPVP